MAFAGVSLLLSVTPGPDMAVVTRNALAHGRRGVVLTTTGIALALSFWISATRPLYGRSSSISPRSLRPRPEVARQRRTRSSRRALAGRVDPVVTGPPPVRRDRG